VAPSSRLTLISPLRVWFIFNVLFVALVVSSWYSSYRLAAADNQRLVASQVLTLTKSRFDDIKNRRFRDFVEGVGREFSDLYVRLRIADDAYEFGKRPSPGHCGDLTYPLGGTGPASEAQITMCRPFQFSTAPMIIVLIVYVLISGLSLGFVRRLERRTTATLVEFLKDSGVEIDSGRDLIGIMADMRDIRQRLDQAQEQERQLIDTRARAELAEQVAHDIRSPLTALEAAAEGMSALPGNKHLQIQGALSRIRDIADDLLNKRRASVAVDGNHALLSPQLLSSLLLPLIAEKRLAISRAARIELRSPDDAASYGLFVRVQSAEFKRVLSNLINNAVEATDGRSGVVRVDVTKEHGRIRVSVADSGRGIPPELLANLGKRGASYGKEGGSGLGLHHARTCVEAWGGRLEIASEVGKGTSVSLVFPAAPTPDWFVKEIELPGGPIVILDDDKGMHSAWKARFDDLGDGGRTIEILCFTTPEELCSWCGENKAEASRALYLLDHDLAGSTATGMSLAAELGLERRMILVTGHDTEAIRTECQQRGIRLLPKALVQHVPIRAGEAAPAVGALRLDAVLIDDDPLTRLTWENAASESGKNLRTFLSAAAFQQESDRIDRRTPVYLDVKLSDGVNGAEESIGIYNLGFKEIYLATGHPPERFAAYTHLRGVVGKTPPWAA
jgi:signal transduction histidine kinase